LSIYNITTTTLKTFGVIGHSKVELFPNHHTLGFFTLHSYFVHDVFERNDILARIGMACKHILTFIIRCSCETEAAIRVRDRYEVNITRETQSFVVKLAICNFSILQYFSKSCSGFIFDHLNFIKPCLGVELDFVFNLVEQKESFVRSL
jgi:hypothetical protein